MLHLPVSYFDSTRTGVLISRVMTDAEGVRNLVGTGLIQLVGGLFTAVIGIGVLFALNSALHSYLIISYAREDGVSLDVGFYYMANAGGRLLGTVLSGRVFQQAGLGACLAISAVFVALAALISLALPRHAVPVSSPA